MRTTSVILLAVVLVLGMSAVALAVDPIYDAGNATFTESAPEAGSNIGTSATAPSATKYGASAWVYKDKFDANFKFEGSYREFQNQTGSGTTPQGGYGSGYYDFDGTPTGDDGYIAGGYDSGPHDGYDTGSNKCKTCHAVHRASGSYRLMRVDNPDDACAYCHIGDHKHATRGAYYRVEDSVYPINGHTMGAGPTIPDSTVKQWLQTKTLEYVDSDGTTVSMTYNLREYNENRNQLFYWTSYRASYHDNGWLRMGPTYLSCMSCHQPHNAQELVWQPVSGAAGYPRGYKLLRVSPSGSTANSGHMIGYTPITEVPGAPDSDMIRVPEGTITRGFGVGVSAAGDGSDVAPATVTWTRWKGEDFAVLDTSGTSAVPRLSVWCADCHNLNIGHYEDVGDTGVNFRASAIHSDRTHTSSGRILECWSCHTTNMPMSDEDYDVYFLGSGHIPDAAGLACVKCHYLENGADYYRDVRWAVPKSDFPHSGADTGFKLLTEVTADATGGVSLVTDAGGPNLDNLCMRCHDLINEKM